MKVLIVGRGVVGTIYGWALSQASVDVTHVVREAGLPSTTLDLLDLRAGYPKQALVSYAPRTVTQISPLDGFDLVIVATKHYQAAQAVQQYLPALPHAIFLLFTANWDGTEEIDRLLERSSMLWGYAEATGGVDAEGRLVVTMNPSVRLGMLEGSDPNRFKAVTELFKAAGLPKGANASWERVTSKTTRRR
jgi:2-dehydropantoate 2-reductase